MLDAYEVHTGCTKIRPLQCEAVISGREILRIEGVDGATREVADGETDRSGCFCADAERGG
jgi:hypothetical protein